MNADSFLKEHSEIDYYFEYNDNEAQKIKDKELYDIYTHHSAKTFTKIVEQQFNIECSEEDVFSKSI